VRHQYTLLLLLVLFSATAPSLLAPIIRDAILNLVVIAIVKNKHLRNEVQVVIVLLRSNIVSVHDFSLRSNLLLVALLGSQQRGFLALDFAPLLAQLLDVVIQLIDTVVDHFRFLVDVGQLRFVEAALLEESPVPGLDFVLALGSFECCFDLVAGAVGDGFACARRWDGWAEGVVCVGCGQSSPCVVLDQISLLTCIFVAFFFDFREQPQSRALAGS
jgi:hypothetical protein